MPPESFCSKTFMLLTCSLAVKNGVDLNGCLWEILCLLKFSLSYFYREILIHLEVNARSLMHLDVCILGISLIVILEGGQ